MPGIWEAMRDSRTPSSVLTKSPPLLRDVELMKQIHEVAGFAANLSIPTLDEKAWRASEPHTPHPRKRRGGGRAQPSGDPVRRADRAAHAGDQRLA